MFSKSSQCLHVLSFVVLYPALVIFLFFFPLTNRPFYRYGSHIELIRFKEYYRMPRGHEYISFVFSRAFRDIFFLLDVIMIAFS